MKPASPLIVKVPIVGAETKRTTLLAAAEELGLPLSRLWRPWITWKTRFVGATSTEYTPLPAHVAPEALAEDVKALTAEPARDAIILIEAGDLKKGAGLRAIVEAAANAIALPCYADEARDLDTVIDDELRKAGMSMTLDARQALRRNLGGDRLASRGEIEKLVLYAHGQKEIDVDDVNALSGDVSGASFDAAVDAVLDGKVGDFDIAFNRHCQSGGHPFLVLSSAMRQLQAIQVMRGQMESGGRNAASVVAGARPPVFFSRRKLVEKTLERWNVEALGRALNRLQTAVLQTRKRPDLSEALARQALLGIAIESARLGQRG